MGRVPCCEKDNVKRGQWTPEEDNKLSSYIAQHGTRNWRLIPKNAGLQRCGKSCRLRWTNYLRPDLKHGEFSENEEQTIVKLHSVVGNRWSLIAAQLPGRTDNDVKNYWNTKLKKRLSGMGIDPVTHKPFSHLIAEIATTLAPPQVAHLAEAALGCFKDEMLHLLTKNRIDFQLNRNSGGTALLPNTMPPPGDNSGYFSQEGKVESDAAIQKIKFSLSRAMQESDMVRCLPNCTNKVLWGSMAADIHGGEAANSNEFDGICDAFQSSVGFHYGSTSFGNDDEGSLWNQSICTESTCTGGERGGMHVKGEDEDDDGANLGKELKGEKSDRVFNSDGDLWDLSDDLINPIV